MLTSECGIVLIKFIVIYSSNKMNATFLAYRFCLSGLEQCTVSYRDGAVRNCLEN